MIPVSATEVVVLFYMHKIHATMSLSIVNWFGTYCLPYTIPEQVLCFTLMIVLMQKLQKGKIYIMGTPMCINYPQSTNLSSYTDGIMRCDVCI